MEPSQKNFSEYGKAELKKFRVWDSVFQKFLSMRKVQEKISEYGDASSKIFPSVENLVEKIVEYGDGGGRFFRLFRPLGTAGGQLAHFFD